MKRTLFSALCCLLLAGCSPSTSGTIPEEELRLSEALDQSGHSFSYSTAAPEMTAGLYTDGERWYIASVRLTDENKIELLEQPMLPAETGREDIQLWYGVCGTAERPWLALQLTEQDPACRSLGIVGAGHSVSLSNSAEEPMQWTVQELDGLLDSEDRLTVTLADLRKDGQEQEPYCKIPLDLTEALEHLN